jgi:hypothetical protein
LGRRVQIGFLELENLHVHGDKPGADFLGPVMHGGSRVVGVLPRHSTEHRDAAAIGILEEISNPASKSGLNRDPLDSALQKIAEALIGVIVPSQPAVTPKVDLVAR